MLDKHILIGLLLLFTVFSGRAQQTTLSSGGDIGGSTGSISFSIGQVFYSTKSGSGGVMNQGVQQPVQSTPTCTNPMVTSTTASSRCGSGSITLDATPSSGSIQWYTTPSGGNPLTHGTDYLISGTSITIANAMSTTTLYAEAIDGTCVSTTRTAVIATIDAIPSAPIAVSQSFCTSVTVADLVAIGTNIQWYSVETGGTALSGGTSLSTGTYYASQIVNGCESPRVAVAIVVASPITLSVVPNQTVCDGQMISDIPIIVGGDVNVTLTAGSSNGSMVPTFLFDGVGANRTLSISTILGQVGATNVTITATSSAGCSTTTRTFLLEVGDKVMEERLYITNSGNNTTSVVSVADNAIINTISTGSWGVSSIPNGDRIYVTNLNNNNVSVINTLDNSVTATIPLSGSPIGITLTPDGAKAYVTHNRFVSVINTTNNTVTATIPVGNNSSGIVTSPDGGKVYVANRNSNSVSVINTVDNTVSATIPVGTSPIGISISPDGTKAYVTNLVGRSVSVINTSSNTVTATIPVGNYPVGITTSTDGGKVYVANRNSNSISVIDASNNKVIATIPVGNYPYGISTSSNGDKLYVTNYSGNSLSVVNTITNSVESTITGFSQPVAFGNFVKKVQTYKSCSSTPSPTLSTISNQNVCEGQTVSNLGITIGGDINAILTASSSNSSITPTFTFGGSGASRTLSIGTLWGQVGTTSITITATGNGGVTTTSFSMTINGAPSAPVASAQNFCDEATVANLVATGTGVQWYSSSTGGIALATTTALSTGTYYVSQTVNGCESTRTAVSVIVNSTPLTLALGTVTSPTSCTIDDGSIIFLTNLPDGIHTLSFRKNGNPAQTTNITVSSGNFVLTGLGLGNYTNFTITLNGCIATLDNLVSLSSPSVFGGILNGSSSVVSGINSTTLSLSGHIGTIVKWQSSIDDSFTNVEDIAATSTTYTVTNLTATRFYRVVVESSGCPTTFSSSASISILTNQAPIARCQPVVREVDAACQVLVSAQEFDGGSFDPDGHTLTSSISFTGPYGLGEHSLEFRVTDINGAFSTCTALLTVVDRIVPTVLTRSVDLVLDDSGRANLSVEQVNAGSFDNCSIQSLTLSKTAFTCADLGTQDVLLTAVDFSGNQTSQRAVIRVLDNQSPRAVANNTVVYLKANGTAELDVFAFSRGSSDNCGIAKIEVNVGLLDCSFIGQRPVEVKLIDPSGNFSKATAFVTVLDTIAPVVSVKDTVLYLDATGKASLPVDKVAASIAESCGIGSISVSRTDFDCSVSSEMVRFTAVDRQGNQGFAQFRVTVQDTTAPVLRIRPAIVYLDKEGIGRLSVPMIDNGSSDNCGITALTLRDTLYNCNEVGERKTLLTARDAAGNTSSIEVSISVRDSLAPMIQARDSIQVFLSAQGTASLNVEAIELGSSDNCGIASRVLSDTLFSCSQVGVVRVAYNVTDVNGNSSEKVIVVTVSDTIAPVLQTQNARLTIGEDGRAVLSTTDVITSATDNCGIATQTLSSTVFGCTQIGNREVSVTVTDVNGNKTEANVMVEIVDGNGICPCSYSILAAESVTLVNNRLSYGGVGTYGVNKLVRLENTRVDKENVFIRSAQIEADATSRPNRVIERQAPQPFTFEQTVSNSSDLRVKSNSEVISSDSQFGVIRINRGGKLTLTNSKIAAERIIIEKGGQLIFSQKAIVGVKDQLKTESDVIVNATNQNVRMFIGKDLVIGQNNSINGYFHTLQEAELKRNRGTDSTRVRGTVVGNTVVALGQVVWEGGVIRCGEDDTDITEVSNQKVDYIAAQKSNDELGELIETQLLEEGESKLYMYGPNPTFTNVTLRFYQTPSVKPTIQIVQSSIRPVDVMVKQTWLSDKILKLDLSELTAGMYLITVRVDGKVQTVKIVKE